MPTFQFRQIDVPLFGVVDVSNQSSWLSAFSSPAATTHVNVDKSALDIIAEELELDAEGLLTDAERYVKGSYRPKARGIGGSALGNLGEVLTYLVNRSSGKNIVRVVSWRSGPGQTIKGSLFPQPDFVVSDHSSLAALEVKTTEAFDFVDLRDMTKKWTHLRPCGPVHWCRQQALPQLGFVNGVQTPQRHSLLVRDGKVVPFPVGKGVATAVIAVDGRTGALRGDSRYKTPPGCRLAQRECWSCLPTDCHFVLVTMSNSPGMLSLGGSAGDGSTGWLRSYERWTQALSSRDLFAVRESLRVLTTALQEWLDEGIAARSPETFSLIGRDTLRRFWGSYLGDAMRNRGLPIDASAVLGELSPTFGWNPAPLAEPVCREASVQEMEDLIREDPKSASTFVASTQLVRSGQQRESVTVIGHSDRIEFYLLSETWWRQERVPTLDLASQVAKRLLSFALQRTGWPVIAGDVPISFRPITAAVGDSDVSLGWESKPAPEVLTRGGFYPHFWCERWPPWPQLLTLGDRRVRLRVKPDGRANLSVSRELL